LNKHSGDDSPQNTSCAHGVAVLVSVMLIFYVHSNQFATGWTVRGLNPVGGPRFSLPVLTGPEAHAASLYSGFLVCFSGVKQPEPGV